MNTKLPAVIDVELLPDGVIADFSEVTKQHRPKAQNQFEWIYNDLAGTDLAAEADPDADGIVVYYHVATTVVGVPVPISKEQAALVRATRYEHGKEIDVLDVNDDGTELYVLSNSGSRRVLANVRARYTIAKRLGCIVEKQGDGICWRGKFHFDFAVE